MSAAYFINEHCKDYNDDFMLCKREDGNPESCAKEGRKVTRCAIDLLRKLEDNCAESFKKHWQCLELNNNYYWKCRTDEKVMNQCVFTKMGLKKVILDAPLSQIPVHMRTDDQRIYK